MVHDDDNNINGFYRDLSNREIMQILLEEIGLTRTELKEDIADLRGEMKELDNKLSLQIKNLSYKVDQNHVAFITNLNDHDRRLTTLEK